MSKSKTDYQRIARNTMKKNRKINIRISESPQWEPYVGRATVPAEMTCNIESGADHAKGKLGKKFSTPDNII